jgi:hypothetical protein
MIITCTSLTKPLTKTYDEILAWTKTYDEIIAWTKTFDKSIEYSWIFINVMPLE